ncbi:MAG: hypothetical protein FJW35_06385 [Acidobacteria bacterium]|nr:hypothetical protein [Acidobacteriota bacterium]
MNFLVDAQLPPALCDLLGNYGHKAWHVSELGLGQALDRAIWDEAIKLDAVVLTKDEDFACRAALKVGGPAIVWLRVGNCSNEALMKWFGALLEDFSARLKTGERLIEIR